MSYFSTLSKDPVDIVCNYLRVDVSTEHYLHQKHLGKQEWEKSSVRFNPTKDAYISNFKLVGRDFSWQLTLDYCYWSKDFGPWPWSLGDKIKRFLLEVKERNYGSFDYDGKLIIWKDSTAIIDTMILTDSLKNKFYAWLLEMDSLVPQDTFIMKSCYIDRDTA